MPPILIDTNVLLYLYDHNQPSKQEQAHRVLDELELSRSGRLSVQCLAEFFSVATVATRKLSPSLTATQALHQVSLFSRLWPVYDLTSMVVLEAGRGVQDHQLSYCDAQIWATARLNQVPTTFSEDFSDGAVLEGVRFVNPFASEFELETWL
jgi:predicted nucleic acid-binding protein